MLKRMLLPPPLAPLTHPRERAEVWQRLQRVSRRAVELQRSVSDWEPRTERRDDDR